MKNRIPSILGVLGFGLSHLALIPILSLYGVTICPVLRSFGFWVGCKYNGSFVAFVILCNLALAFPMFRFFKQRWRDQGSSAEVFTFRVTVLISYSLVFVAGVYGLTQYLTALRVPSSTIQRLAAALAYAGILLGVLHLQISDGLAMAWLRDRRELAVTEDSALTETREGWRTLVGRWIAGSLWSFLPEAGAITIGVFVLYRTFVTLGEEASAQSLTSELVFDQFRPLAKVGGLLLGWIALNRLMASLRDYRLLRDVREHLKALGQMNTHYFSITVAAGFWESIFRGLNQTTGLIRQRSRLVQGFASYVVQDVVEQYLSTSQVKPKGSLRELAVISSDLRDFTRMSHQMAPEDVVETLNIYFADMIEILSERRVILDKFIGDGILAYVDPEVPSAESLTLAIQAALAMRDGLRRTNEKLRARKLPPLKLGVAVHSGPVVLGSIGSPKRMQYTVVGNTVNLTCRLESFCKTLGTDVIITESVWRDLPEDLKGRFVSLGKHEVRGIADSVALYGSPDAQDASAPLSQAA